MSERDDLDVPGVLDEPEADERPRWMLLAVPLLLLAAITVVVVGQGGGTQEEVRSGGAGSGVTDPATSDPTADRDRSDDDGAEPAPPAIGVPLESVDWPSLAYPVDCGGETVGELLALHEPEAGRQVAVVAVSCVAGAGTPPSAVLVYDHADSPRDPHLAQTLLEYRDNWTPAGATATGGNLAIEVYGYSTDEVARCCPDLHLDLTWAWSEGSYQLTSPPPDHARLPAS